MYMQYVVTSSQTRAKSEAALQTPSLSEPTSAAGLLSKQMF